MPRYSSQAAVEGTSETDPLILQNDIEHNLYRLQKFLLVLNTLTNEVFFHAGREHSDKADHPDVTREEFHLTGFLVDELMTCAETLAADVHRANGPTSTGAQ